MLHDLIVFGAGMAGGHFAWETVVKVYTWVKTKITHKV